MSLYDLQNNFTGGTTKLGETKSSQPDIGGITVGNQYGGFFEKNPSGESPYQTGHFLTSPVLPYGQNSRGIVETGLLGIANAPTSIIRLADTLLSPSTYWNLGRVGAGGLQSIPGIKEFYDTFSQGKGKEILQTNREVFHNFVDTLRNQFGSIENWKRSISEDPAGTALLVRGLMEGAAGISQKAGMETTAGIFSKAGETVLPIEKIPDIVEKLKTTSQTPEEIASKITNAEPKEIPKVVNTLNNIDLSGVKTYAEAAQKIQKEGIDINQNLVDEKLGKSTNTFKTEDLTQTAGKIKTDFVSQALDQLQEYYNKTNSPQDEARIIDLKNQYQETGLTPKEINDVAKEHGTNLNAYNANGELASGLSRQAAENTRTGVKEIARSLMPDEQTRLIDRNTSDMIKTKELMQERDIAAQKVLNRIQKAGLLEKLGRAVGLTADIITLHSARGILRSIFGFKGDMSLNALEIQKQLPKQIELFNKLSNMEPKVAEQLIENPTVKVPIQNLSPFERNINIIKPKKIEVKNLTPNEVEILRTIRYSDEKFINDKNINTNEIPKSEINKIQKLFSDYQNLNSNPNKIIYYFEKNPKIFEEYNKTAIESLKGIKYLYRGGDNEGISYTTQKSVAQSFADDLTDKFGDIAEENGGIRGRVEKITVESVKDRIVFVSNIGQKGNIIGQEGEVIVLPYKP